MKTQRASAPAPAPSKTHSKDIAFHLIEQNIPCLILFSDFVLLTYLMLIL